MSWSIALRRSPKPGALTATEVNVPRILLTTRVARASPSTSSAMISSGLPVCMTFSRTGHQVVDGADLLVDEEDQRVVEDGLLALGVGHEVGRQVALVELHALGELEVDAEGVGLLDGDRAVLAHLVDGVGQDLADGGVGGRDGGHLGDLGLGVDLLGLLLDGVDGGGHRLVDALAQAQRVGAGGHVAQPLVDEGLGQHGGGGGAVAGHVVGLGGHFLDQLGAHVLEDVLQLHLTGDGHAVVGDGGGTELLLDDDVAALRAEGHLDRVGQLVHAGFEAAAGGFVELQDLRTLPWTPWPGRHGSDRISRSSPSDGDLGAAVLGVDDGVADLDVEGDELARGLGATAGADGEYLALLGLLFGGVGDDQAGGGGLLGFTGADDDPVVKGVQTSWVRASCGTR